VWGSPCLHFVIFVSSLRLLRVSYIPASVSVVSARVATSRGVSRAGYSTYHHVVRHLQTKKMFMTLIGN
jgi:hypothetical protein